MSEIAEKLQDSQKKLDYLRASVSEIMATCDAEERDLTDEEDIQLSDYAEQIEAEEKRMKQLETAEKAMAERVVQRAAPAIIQEHGSRERKPGEVIFKHATAAFLAHCNRMPLEVAVKKAYPGDKGLAAVIKSVNEPAATDVVGWAQELTEEANQGFLDLLRGDFVVPQLWSVAGLNLNFMGNTAINIPSRGGSDTDMRSGWTGERDAIPVRRMTTETQKIMPYKWAAISTFSKELGMRSVPQIQQLITQSIIADTGTALDNDYLGSAPAVAGYNPAGIFDGVPGTPASSGGATVGEDMLTDLRNLIDPFYTNNLSGNIRIGIHPSNALAMSLVLYNGTYLFRDELARGTLFGIPVIQSTNIPVTELQAYVMSAQAVALGASTFDVSDSATIVEVDDDGVPPNMGAGYPRDPSGSVGDAAETVPPSPVRSLWQTETVGVKHVQYLSWAKLRPGSVNRITGIDY